MDMLFGTYCRPEHHEPPHKVGLAGVKTFPGDFVTHLGLPFQHDPSSIQLEDGWSQGRPELSVAENS